MSKRPAKARHGKPAAPAPGDYERLVAEISVLVERARHMAARSVNSILTATYWEVGRRIVEFEQGGKARAEYGERLLVRLADDLTARHGRGFSRQGLQKMRSFFLEWEICPTPSGKSEARAKCPTPSGKSEGEKCHTVSGQSETRNPRTTFAESARTLLRVTAPVQSARPLADVFPLSWSQYVRLMSVENPELVVWPPPVWIEAKFGALRSLRGMKRSPSPFMSPYVSSTTA